MYCFCFSVGVWDMGVFFSEREDAADEFRSLALYCVVLRGSLSLDDVRRECERVFLSPCGMGSSDLARRYLYSTRSQTQALYHMVLAHECMYSSDRLVDLISVSSIFDYHPVFKSISLRDAEI